MSNNKEFDNLYKGSTIIGTLTSTRIGWTERV